MIRNSKLLNTSAEISFIFITLVLLAFPFHIGFNEADVVPYARSVYNPDWLKSDWYLGQSIPYRYLFSYVIGFSTEKFGWVATIFGGRFLSYLLFAVALRKLSRWLYSGSLFFLFYLSWVIFIKAFRFGLGDAGEWIVGGLESKVFAYVFAILSLVALAERKHRAGWVYAGLALSFHLLIGIYHLFCTLPVIFLIRKSNKDFLIKLAKSAYMFIITGSVGLFGIFYQIFIADPEGDLRGWEIYVNIRVSSHTIPDFSLKTWLVLGLFTAGAVWFFFKGWKQEIRLLSSYALFSVLILLIGLIVYTIPGGIPYMRFYFFRFSDVMLPLLVVIMLTSLLTEGTPGRFLSARMRHAKLMVFLLAGVLCISGIQNLVEEGNLDASKILQRTSSDPEMAKWIREHTAKDDVFIIDPGDFYFYINCERPVFVSWKHSPQNSHNIMEWYSRLKYLNHNKDFRQLEKVKESYRNLSKQDILLLRVKYPEVDYLLMPEASKLDFPVRFSTDRQVLYDIRD